jgi:hypothetical protein
MADCCKCGNDLSGSIKCGYFLTSWEPVSFSRRTLFHSVYTGLFTKFKKDRLYLYVFLSKKYIFISLFIYLSISVFNIMHGDTIKYNLMHSKIKNIHYLPMSTSTTAHHNIEFSIYEDLCEDVIIPLFNSRINSQFNTHLFLH